MNTLRLSLLAFGGLFALAACAVLGGFIYAILEGGESPPRSALLGILAFEAVLVCTAGGFFGLAGVVGRKADARDRAERLPFASVEFPCPQCDSACVVQRPEEEHVLARTTYKGRCLDCGHRFDVSRQEWQGLPLPQSGDAHETWGDWLHVVKKTHMTAGQTVLVILGIVVFFVAAIVLFDVDDLERWGGVGELVALAFFVAIIYAFWWMGRSLFPPERATDEHCTRCGYDLVGNESEPCPECGAQARLNTPSGSPRL